MKLGTLKYACDRCGTETDTMAPTGRLPFKWAHITLPGVVSDRDICPNCVSDIRVWWYSPAEVSGVLIDQVGVAVAELGATS